MIAVDDLRPAIAALGDPRAITPHLDRLVNRSIGFTQAHCQHPICTASRACALTGCRPDRTRVHLLDTLLSDANPTLATLPQTFRAAGYRTISLGKVYHHATDDPAGWTNRPLAPKVVFPTHVLPENVALNQQWTLTRKTDPSVRRAPSTECADVPDDTYVDPQLASAAVDAINAADTTPFFIAVGFTKPHLPFTCPKKYWDLYDRDELARSVPHEALIDPAPATVHDWGELRHYADIPSAPADVDPAKRAELIHGYYACVSFLDACVGQLLDGLDASGKADETIVCLWADHGLILGEYRMWAKHTLLDAATRVPLIISDPRLATNGQRCDKLVELIDLFPTLVDLCDLPLPTTVQGTSLRPLLKQPTAAWKDVVFNQFPRNLDRKLGRSVRTPTRRFTRWRDPRGIDPDQVELYDMTCDAIETQNVANDPAYADDVASLTRVLDQQQAADG